MLIELATMYQNVNKTELQELIDYYNKNCYPQVKRKYRMKMGDNWCAMFTTVIANMCDLNSDKFPYEVSCYYQMMIAKERGKFTNMISEVKPNDLILYSWKKNGVPNHVGFVTDISDGIISTVEGNFKNTVGFRKVKVGNPQVLGFIKL